MNVHIGHYFRSSEHLDEVEIDAHLRSQALHWILENRSAAIKLYFAKALNFFNWKNELKTSSESSLARELIMFFTYYPLLAVVSLRILCFRIPGLRPLEKVFIILYLATALFFAIFFTRIRFRIPCDLLLIGLAATSLEQFLLFLKKRGKMREDSR